jgi:hypothetical protein
MATTRKRQIIRLAVIVLAFPCCAYVSSYLTICFAIGLGVYSPPAQGSAGHYVQATIWAPMFWYADESGLPGSAA